MKAGLGLGLGVGRICLDVCSSRCVGVFLELAAHEGIGIDVSKNTKLT